MNIKEEMLKQFPDVELQFNDIDVNVNQVKAILINEVVPNSSVDDFYGDREGDYATSAVSFFQEIGYPVTSTMELLEKGIYFTNTLKSPKAHSSIEKSEMEASLPFLDYELSLFPNVKVIMLMGDAAKKAFNFITKKNDGKNVVPSISTYKIRNSELYYHTVRIMPSYIMTGMNLRIEKSKRTMICEDIANMLDILSSIKHYIRYIMRSKYNSNIATCCSYWESIFI